MSDSFITNQKFRRPSIVLADLLRNEMSGQYLKRGDTIPFMFRAMVYAVDTEGGRLENPTGSGGAITQTLVLDGKVEQYVAEPKVGDRPNPPDSVRARIITDSRDYFFGDDDLRTFWPMFPGLQNPSPGELVYVVFEENSHGLWISKVPFDNEFDNPSSVILSQVSNRVAKDLKSTPFDDGTTAPPDDMNPVSAPPNVGSKNDLFGKAK